MMKWHLQVQSQEDAYQNKPSVTFKLQPDNGRDVILITTSQSNWSWIKVESQSIATVIAA